MVTVMREKRGRKWKKWEECKEEEVNSKGDDGGGGDWKGVGSSETDWDKER